MRHSIFRTVIGVLFGLTGIISIVQSMAFLGLSFFSQNDLPNHSRIKIFALYLVGEIILGLVCYFVPENKAIDDFLFVNYQCAAFSSGYIFIVALFTGFPDYANLNSIPSITLMILCMFILIGFIKFQANKDKTSRKRANWWQ